MRSTLFYIPHADAIFEIPLFGVGWLLGLLLLGSLTLLGFHLLYRNWQGFVTSELPLLAIVGAVIVWGAPLVEEHTAAGVAVGIPIRGYGLMVLMGIVLGTLLLVHESRRMGLNAEVMMSLAFWMVVSGFLGARIFYVIEYWPQFSEPALKDTLRNIAMINDGGLVVYGSFIGASITVLLFVYNHGLPLLATADLLAPCMMLGVTIGRIGCFMNGCCWGGLCDESSLGITFPQGSPPYIRQIKDGVLLDMKFAKGPNSTHSVQQVDAGGLGDREGVQVGDTVRYIQFPDEATFNRLRHGESVDEALVSITLDDGRRISWELGRLPDRSAPVYPAQILSSLNAAFIGLFLWAYYPVRRRDGEVAALLASIYPVTRILLERIRTDESGLFSFSFRLTISQTISILILAGVVALWVYVLSRPKGSALPLRTEST